MYRFIVIVASKVLWDRKVGAKVFVFWVKIIRIGLHGEVSHLPRGAPIVDDPLVNRIPVSGASLVVPEKNITFKIQFVDAFSQ